MAEKMYSFTHAISETKLLALISQHADEVRIDIMEAPQKKGQRRLQNGTPSPLMIEGPARKQPAPKLAEPGPLPQMIEGPARKQPAPKLAEPGPLPQPMRKGAGGKKSTPHLTLEYLALHRSRIVPMAELETNAVRHHKPKHSVSVAISGFIKKGFVERVGKGQYKILQEGIAKITPTDAPATPQKAKQTGVGRGNYDRSQSGKGTGLIWAELVKGEPVASQPFRQVYTENGLAPKSIPNAFSTFMRRGLARKISKGVFQITPKGAELHAQQTATESSTT